MKLKKVLKSPSFWFKNLYEKDTALTITYGYNYLGNKTLEKESTDNIRYTNNGLEKRDNSTIMDCEKTIFDNVI